MSIPVPLDELGAALAERPWGYLVTVGPDLRAHLLAVPTRFEDGRLSLDPGRSSRANAAARPEVTLVFPPATGSEYSLIVDGSAVAAADGRLEVIPSSAILHRPALPSD